MSGILAQGTLIKMGAAAGSVTAIGGITSFSGPSTSRTVIDSTDLSSTAKEFKIGLVDNGDMSFELNYDTDAHDALDDAFEAATLMAWELVFSNGDKRTFYAYIMSFQPEGSIDSLLTAKVGLKISGAVTRVQAS